MADATLKKLIALMDKAEAAPVRRAALLLAGSVGAGKDAPLVAALASALDDPDPEARGNAIQALGALHVETALPRLVEMVRDGGPFLEAAARAAGRLGARGTKAVEKLLTEAHPFLRRRIAAALAHGGTESAAVAAAHALVNDDPGVVEAAGRSLAEELPQLGASQRRALAKNLQAMLKEKRKPPLPPASEAAMLRILAALHEATAEALFWPRLDAARPAVVRAAALQGLGSLPEPKLAANFDRLLACANDADVHVSAPALMFLQKAPVTKKHQRDWAKLFNAADIAVRRFAIEKLGAFDAKEIVQGLVQQLHHADRDVRDLALQALAKTKSGRQALVDALVSAENVDHIWFLTRAVEAHAKAWPTTIRTKVFQQFSHYRDADDRRAEPLFHLLREIDPAWIRDQIEARALALRQKKKYESALNYLRLLTRDPGCNEDIRFEMAAISLKLSSKDLAPEARGNDPTLGQFAHLLQDLTFDLSDKVAKAKWLAPDDLFYLGFHFAEKTHREQTFGGDVLNLLIKRSPSSQLGKDAKRKLKSEGLN